MMAFFFHITVLVSLVITASSFSKVLPSLHHGRQRRIRANSSRSTSTTHNNNIHHGVHHEEATVSIATRSSIDGIQEHNNGSISPTPITQLNHDIVSKLDIDPLLKHVSSYTRTKRGKDAILSLLPSPNLSALDLYLQKKGSNRKKQNRRLGWYQSNDVVDVGVQKSALYKSNDAVQPNNAGVIVAQSAQEATAEYKLVHQAMEVLRSQNLSKPQLKIPLPPMFDLNDSNYDTDDDEWIDTCINPLPMGEEDMVEEIDLYTILQAEKVTELLLNTFDWAAREEVMDSAPELSNVFRKVLIEPSKHHDLDAQTDDGEDQKKLSIISSLSRLYKSLHGSVEVQKEGSKSYQFRLSSSHDGFKELDALRQREDDSIKRLNKVGTSASDKAQANKLATIRDEIAAVEYQIHKSLISAMVRAAPDVKVAFIALARLDVIFAKAAFGLEWNGVIPQVGQEGRINVQQFIHPVLAMEKKFESGNGLTPKPPSIVPIDLLLPGKGSYQALMISGPNAGGKTLALKSFGLVSVMVKLALPITVARSPIDDSLVVDLFHLDVQVGDNQSLLSGESTLMARLNSLSGLIEKSTSEVKDCKYASQPGYDSHTPIYLT